MQRQMQTAPASATAAELSAIVCLELFQQGLVLRLDFGFFFERFADLVIGSGAYVFFRKVLEGIVNAGRAGIFLILYFLQDGQFIFGGVCCRKLFLVVSYF